jgi:hypothetical protein
VSCSGCEFEFWVWSLLLSLQVLARARLVLKFFWVESWIYEFCTKRSTLLRGISAPRPLQRPARSSGRSLFFMHFSPLGAHLSSPGGSFMLELWVWSLLARPHGQAWAELELKFWFVSMRMLCLASDCEFKIRVCSLLARPHGQACAGLVLKKNSWV